MTLYSCNHIVKLIYIEKTMPLSQSVTQSEHFKESHSTIGELKVPLFQNFNGNRWASNIKIFITKGREEEPSNSIVPFHSIDLMQLY